ncbi:MAG TPA: hypothetical protein VGH12_06835, partial [Steroidobacteraceae bacterium]
NMQVVREISSQTAEGSTATSTSIAKLAALSAQLRKSVAGFRLPDFGDGSGGVAGGVAPKPAAVAKPAAKPVPNAAPAKLPPLTEPMKSADSPKNAGNTAKLRKASGIGA